MNPPSKLKTVAITVATTTALAVGSAALYFGVKPIENSNIQVATVNQPTPAPTIIDLKIKGNRASRIYHLKGCPNYNDIAERNIVWFKTREEAETRRFRMAKNC